jgi:hypothetical protein
MDDKKPAKPEWMGRPVSGKKDIEDLERLAAIKEFIGKMPRDEAENAAYREWQRNQHLSGAGHHLAGMKAAAAAGGSDEEAKKHFMYYAAHMGALGFNPHDAVPPEVSEHVNPGKEHAPKYKFQPHDFDDQAISQPKSK